MKDELINAVELLEPQDDIAAVALMLVESVAIFADGDGDADNTPLRLLDDVNEVFDDGDKVAIAVPVESRVCEAVGLDEGEVRAVSVSAEENE
jgi:hypothetical protein